MDSLNNHMENPCMSGFVSEGLSTGIETTFKFLMVMLFNTMVS